MGHAGWLNRARFVATCALVVACAGEKGPGPRTQAGAPTGMIAPPDAGATARALNASPLALDDAENAALAKRGFVISDRRHFPSFAEGWLAIYKADLPLYVSADALLHVVHRSYDSILKDIELHVLIPKLDGLLGGMRARLAGAEGASLPARTRADADFFLGVALSLLDRSRPAPVAGASAKEMDKWIQLAFKAEGEAQLPLYGSPRFVDFSQFKPRGHYVVAETSRASGADKPHQGGLPAYFRAMMWLGRTDARITEPGRNRVLELHRRELELACGLRALMGQVEMAAWQELETTMNTFVGERDAMGPADVDRFYLDLGIAGFAGLASVSDTKILETIARGNYGHQRIASDLLLGDERQPAALPSSFSFTGQRYIVDSHVFSDLVFDRVTPGAHPARMLPNPLDVAFAVLNNDRARTLLADEIEKYGYGPNLVAARARTEANGDRFWETSLYNSWLGALRALSPAKDAEVPPVARTEAWGRRILSTQLASWAELRHDTVLYAKQSYTGGFACSFPDVYVDPYPLFYARLVGFADRGKALVGALDYGGASWLKDKIGAFFTNLGAAAERLGQMANRQRRGELPTNDDLAFVNQALIERPQGISCGGPPPREVHGWYVDLFYGGDPLAPKPTIADVHTQWTDEGGSTVGNVLHVGTGSPRLFVVDVDASRRFVGVVSAYAEITMSHFLRLTDQDWQEMVAKQSPADVEWMKDLVVR